MQDFLKPSGVSYFRCNEYSSAVLYIFMISFSNSLKQINYCLYIVPLIQLIFKNYVSNSLWHYFKKYDLIWLCTSLWGGTNIELKTPLLTHLSSFLKWKELCK